MMLFGKQRTSAGRGGGAKTAPSTVSEREIQPGAQQRRARAHYDPIVNVAVDRNRWVLVSFLLFILLLLSMLINSGLAPAKEVVPYIMEIDPETRRVAQTSRLQLFKPARADIAFAAANFTEKLMSVQRHLLEINLTEAQGLTCGVARQQINAYVRQTRPKSSLVSDPSYVRVVRFPTDPVFPPQADNTVILRVKTVTDTVKDNIGREEAFWVMTLNYVLRKPGKLPFEQFRRNPLGICFTSFTISKEEAFTR